MRWYWIILIFAILFFGVRFLLQTNKGILELLAVISFLALLVYAGSILVSYVSQDFKYN